MRLIVRYYNGDIDNIKIKSAKHLNQILAIICWSEVKDGELKFLP